MPTLLITGANRGLGLEFARQYAADGWHVVATCRDPERSKELRSLPGSVMVHRLDVADFAAVAALGRTLAEHTIDVFIANAAVVDVPPDTPPGAIDEAGWMRMFRVNTMAPLACAAAFVRQVARSNERKMIAMSSWRGSIASNLKGGYYAYRSTKAALNSVWRAFAIDHPEVIAAVLSPGPVRTDMTRYDPERWPTLPLPEQRVPDLRRVIAGLAQSHSGRFWHYTGEELPW